LAETVPGPTTTLLGKLAKEYHIVILCSIFEKTKEKISKKITKKNIYTAVVIGTRVE